MGQCQKIYILEKECKVPLVSNNSKNTWMGLVLIPSINWTIICLHDNIKLYVIKGFGVPILNDFFTKN
jgi:hypothetical protein